MARSARSVSGTGVLCISLTLLGWASVPLFLRYFVPYMDAWTTNGWRYGVSALFWSPVLVIAARRAKLPPGLWRGAVVPSLFNCLGQVCFAWAPYFIDPGLMAFLLRFQIILIALGAYLLFPSERRVIRAPAYGIGIVIIVLGSIGTIMLGEEVPAGARAFGVALAVVAGGLFGGYVLSVRYYMQGMSSILAFAAISQYTALGMVGLMLGLSADHGAAAMALDGHAFAMLIASAFIGIALAHVFYYASIARLGVSVSSGVILLAPFMTAVASYLIFGERLTVWQWLSGTAAMIGAVAILSAQRRLEEPAAVIPPAPEPAPAPA